MNTAYLVLDDGTIFEGDAWGSIGETFGEIVTEEDAKKLINEADLDGDGYINYNEFVSIMMSK